MADIVFRGTPYGDITILDSWPEWLKTVWMNALIAAGVTMPKVPFTPTYETGEVHWPNNDGTIATAPIDRFQLASKETADKLAAMYGAPGAPLRVIETSFVGAGPVTSTAVVRLIVWPNNVAIVAGMMAAPFTLNPEDQFPGVADHAVRAIIAARGAA